MLSCHVYLVYAILITVNPIKPCVPQVNPDVFFAPWQELQSLRASVAQQRRHLAERNADVARAKDRLREELQHNSSKGGCSIS